VCGLWSFKVRIQSCFANFESESAPDPVQIRNKQFNSCLTPDKQHRQTTNNCSMANTKVQIQSSSGHSKENLTPDYVEGSRSPDPKNPKSSPCTLLLRRFLSSVSEQRIMYAVCVLCAGCAVDWTICGGAVWQCSFVVCEGQVIRFQEARFSETEWLRVQYRLVRIRSTVYCS